MKICYICFLPVMQSRFCFRFGGLFSIPLSLWLSVRTVRYQSGTKGRNRTYSPLLNRESHYRYATLVWQAVEDLNPQLSFWRRLWYRFTNSLCCWVVWLVSRLTRDVRAFTEATPQSVAVWSLNMTPVETTIHSAFSSTCLLEHLMGLEPICLAWKASTLPITS